MDIRSTKTRRKLKDALKSLLMKYPFEKITISDICEEAMINRVTFYTHYHDKNEILEDSIRDIVLRIINPSLEEYIKNSDKENAMVDLLKNISSNSISQIYKYKDIIANFKRRESPSLLNAVRNVCNRESQALIIHVLSISGAKYPEELLMAFLIGGVYKTIETSVFSNNHYSEDTVKDLVNNLIEGFMNSPLFFRK